MRSRPVVTMVSMVARIRNEGGHGTMVPESVIATTVALAMPPMVVTTLSAHFLQYPVEDSRCNPIDDHVAEIEVIVVPAALRMPFNREHRLHAESKHCQSGEYCRSQSFHRLVSLVCVSADTARRLATTRYR